MIGDPRLPERFWAKVQPREDGCWYWTAAVNNQNYGLFNINRRLWLSHRAAYEALVGPIPDGLNIDHLCRVRRCCNPAHLEPVTQAENVRRHFSLQTHCVNDHPLPGANLAVYGNNRRRCLTCKREKQRIYIANVRRSGPAREQDYLTEEQVNEILHGSIHTTRKLLTAGDIRSAKIAGRRLVRRDWLDAYIESQASGGERRLSSRRLGRAS